MSEGRPASRGVVVAVGRDGGHGGVTSSHLLACLPVQPRGTLIRSVVESAMDQWDAEVLCDLLKWVQTYRVSVNRGMVIQVGTDR